MLNNGVLDLHLGSYGLKGVGHFDECGVYVMIRGYSNEYRISKSNFCPNNVN